MYSYSWDDGINWTSYQNGNSYDVSGLNEETSYLVRVKVKALHEGSSAEDTETISSETEVMTPADQASIHIKREGQWVKGKTWYKKDGHWIKAKKIYIKKDNIWYINKNDIDRAI
jgi:DNA-binding GntR family transcriptional regulator